ncbi:MAG: SLOG family protein [Kiloniellaceae bacterium]
MKTIVAGGRDYRFDDFDRRLLDRLRIRHGISEVVCGMAHGADTSGKEWAEAMGIPVAEFPADWNKHGRAAGPIRNRRMAEYGDALVAFPGGRGTSNMIKQARELGLRVMDVGRIGSVVRRCAAKKKADPKP